MLNHQHIKSTVKAVGTVLLCTKEAPHTWHTDMALTPPALFFVMARVPHKPELCTYHAVVASWLWSFHPVLNTYFWLACAWHDSSGTLSHLCTEAPSLLNSRRWGYLEKGPLQTWLATVKSDRRRLDTYKKNTMWKQNQRAGKCVFKLRGDLTACNLPVTWESSAPFSGANLIDA